MARIYGPGQSVGTYRITREMNRGLMAVSYAAQASDGQAVFLKQYKSPSVRADWYDDFIRYQLELKRRVDGGVFKNFCYRFVDAFEYERCYFQVFEFLDHSYSLQEILDKCSTKPDHVAPNQRLIMAKVLLSGIDALHAAKIIHSDLKPDNVMLISDASIVAGYRLRIIDMDFSILADRRAPWHGKKGTGYFGTVGYLSPEHLRGEVPQAASDVFTLGLMLYELLCGAHPYRSGDVDRDHANAMAHGARPVRLVGTLAALPNAGEIVDAIHRCLSPDPARRPTALEMNQVLNNRVSRPDGPPPPDSKVVSTGRTPAEPTGREGVLAPPPPLLGRLVLRAASGDEKAFSIQTPIGRSLLRSFGPDSKYVDDHQFTVSKDGGAWYVVPATGVRNETLLNGRRVVERTRLKVGDVLGVGSEVKSIVKLPMTVGFGS